MFDIVIANGDVVDGQKTARYRADVGVQKGRITAMGDLREASCRQRVDAGGRVVAPGFIDVHTHSDGWLLKTPCLLPKILQGYTTELLMADGMSYAPVCQETAPQWLFYLRGLNGLRLDEYRGWRTAADYLRQLDGRNVQNVAAHLPYANVRSLACGFGPRAADDFQARQIEHEVRRGMEEGAVGLSTGLDYIAQCHATTGELVRACAALAPFAAPYVTHLRYRLGPVPALREAVEIGRRAGVPVHVSHLKTSSPEVAEAWFGILEAASRDMDLTFDVYPYLPGSTLLSYFLPHEVWQHGPVAAMDRLRCPRIRRQLREGLEADDAGILEALDRIRIAWVPGRDHGCWHGKRLREFVTQSGLPAEDALCDLLIEERLAVLCVVDEGDDTPVDAWIAHPLGMIGSDGIYFPDGAVHPRVYGTAGRILGRCVRDRRLLSLEEAVWKLSGFPAQRFGLAGRGAVREGYAADLVVLDPATIRDQATFDDPHRPTIGITDVLVNGVAVVRDGQPVAGLSEPLPGRFLRRGE